jgi:hypothetical protein
MTINNILGQHLETFAPELAAAQHEMQEALAQINHSKRDPKAVQALQALGERLVEAVMEIDREYNIAQYLTDLQLVVYGPGRFNLFLNEIQKPQATPIVFGKEQRSIQLYENDHGKQESVAGGRGPGGQTAGRSSTVGSDPAAAPAGGSGPAVRVGESLPIAPG